MIFTDIADIDAPSRRMRVKAKGCLSPWTTDEIRDQMRLRDFYLTKFNKTNNRDWFRFKEAKNQVKRSLNSAKSDYFDESKISSQNSSRFLQGLSRILNGEKYCQASTLRDEGKTISDSKKVVNGYNTNWEKCRGTISSF